MSDDNNNEYDKRLQERFCTSGQWIFSKIEKVIEELPNLELNVAASFGPPQPALGQFSPEELKRVQDNFPYPHKIKKTFYD